jgi:hypothetical protein
MRQERAGAQRPARRVGTLRRHDTARRNGSLQRHGSLQRRGSLRRRGTVLIMVVAVLGILFVAGAALLNVVTFSSRSLDAAKIDRENRDAVDAVERLVTRVLAESFINTDVIDPALPFGIPNSVNSQLVMHQPGRPDLPCAIDSSTNEPTDCVLALPAPVEVPGLHLMDVAEPVEANPGTGDWRCEYRLVSNLEAALDGRTLYSPVTATQGLGDDLTVTVNDPSAVQGMGGMYLRGSVPVMLRPGAVPSWRFYNDAVGDGALTSAEINLPLGSLAAELRRSLANRLRAGGGAVGAGPDALTLTLRVVPHGAMADLNASHPYLRRAALGFSYRFDPPFAPTEPTNEILFAGAPYLPEANEWFLRNRGALAPRGLPANRLIENLAPELLAPVTMNTQLYDTGTLNLTVLADPTSRRWWTFDPVADTATQTDSWRMLMYPENAAAGTYDVSHNVTTVSYDDLLMRSYVVETGTGPQDVITDLKAQDGNANGDVNYRDSQRFAIDNYPHFLSGSGDGLAGRLKVSLPYLDQYLKDIDLAGLAALSSGPRRGQKRLQFIRTIQDAFTLMLRNQPDFNLDGVPDPIVAREDSVKLSQLPPDERDIAVQAAMLTANLIDYADNNDDPQPVDVIDLSGNQVLGESDEPLVAYGFERQPFITEVYTSTTSIGPSNVKEAEEGSAIMAVELYNPYDRPIDLSSFELTDLNTMANTPNLESQVTANPLQRMRSLPLTGSIPGAPALPLNDPSRFVTFCGYGANCPNGGDANGGESIGDFGIDADSVIALVRVITYPNGTVEKIVVDQLNAGEAIEDPFSSITGDKPKLGKVSDGAAGEVVQVSIQRDTKPDFWRFTVPQTIALYDPTQPTPGVINHPSSNQELLDVNVHPPVFPVHLDLANSGSFALAFPTTGSMLLVSRYAHIYDATPYDNLGTSVISPFNRIKSGTPGNNLLSPTPDGREGNLFGRRDQIDNGRMPVFDVIPVVGARDRRIPTPPTPGESEGLDVLPWGQYVFDYFTAIPFEIGEPGLTNPVYLLTQAPYLKEFPPVDQSGLRVRGRVNINAASWTVLSAIPMLNVETFFPSGYQADLIAGLGNGREILGDDLAKAIVAYREARSAWTPTFDPGAYGQDRDPFSSAASTDADFYRPRRGFGFLTVGELLNVRHPSVNGASVRMDAGAIDQPSDVPITDNKARFEHAIANIVAMDDNWVTTRSHVFTIYGVIRGAHAPLPDLADPDYDAKLRSFNEANQKAIRFQSTVDRLPMIFGSRQPVRIGSRITGGYADVRSE